MQTKTKQFFVKLFLSISLLSICFGFLIQEKSPTDLKDFKIIIETTENGISMKSLKGSAWVNLSFSLKKNKWQAIDEYGMTELEKVNQDKDSNLADYLFAISKTDDGIELKGFEGTAWEMLKFKHSTKNIQAINQFGMTD